MGIEVTSEKRLESDIESFFTSAEGGYSQGKDEYDPEFGVYADTLIGFIKDTQPREWKRFVSYNSINPERNFLVKFRNACETYGVLEVLRHGFKHRGIDFKVCYFKPESRLNRTSENLY